MELEQYISTGIIESYLLGVASREEVIELQFMRQLYPMLETEIAIVEGRMEKAALAEAVPPPAIVWEGIEQRLNWESGQQQTEDERKHYTFINMQPKAGTYISVHRSWKPILVTIFVLSKIFLIGALFYYFKSQSLQEKLDAVQHPQTISSPK